MSVGAPPVFCKLHAGGSNQPDSKTCSTYHNPPLDTTRPRASYARPWVSGSGTLVLNETIRLDRDSQLPESTVSSTVPVVARNRDLGARSCDRPLRPLPATGLGFSWLVSRECHWKKSDQPESCPYSAPQTTNSSPMNRYRGDRAVKRGWKTNVVNST